MEQLKGALALHLLRSGSTFLQPKQLDTIVTLFMLFGEGDAFTEASSGIDQGRYRIDSTLVSRFYDTCPAPLKLELFDTFATSRLDPAIFKRLIADAWSLPANSIDQRVRIALRLEGFLRRNPGRAEEHRALILELLRSPQRRLCVRGLYQLSFLNDAEQQDLARLQKKLSAASPDLRMNALNGLSEWTNRFRKLSPRVLAFCTSPALHQRARQLFRADPSKDVRSCAYFFLRALGAYRRASGA